MGTRIINFILNSFLLPGMGSREKRDLQLSSKIVQNRGNNVPYVLSQGQVVGMKHSTSLKLRPDVSHDKYYYLLSQL